MTTDEVLVNPHALEPLFMPWDEPNQHRVRAKSPDEPAQIVTGRRPSPIAIAQNLRQAVTDWRLGAYAGASATTRQLLHHWFDEQHAGVTPDGEPFEFRYYFCQREAIETLIYLVEVRNITSLSALVAEFQGRDAERAALGIAPEEDLWSRYAFKLATGAGKTKVMALAIVWSYFHALYEPDSTMARHFVVIAPNLTVYERLKEDFGAGKVFVADPLIPAAWLGDWNLTTVLQDEASGAATGGTLYLTNIHRLYEKRKIKAAVETYDWAGPPVSRASALDTGELLRERITSHPRVMVMNDEAHHVWDPGSAWNEAIAYLHDTIRKRTGTGLVAQLDFSATPKDNRGQIFKHVVCDTPLGEAVDGGIVKTPIIGKGDNLNPRASEDASEVYQQHLMLGYSRWRESMREWEGSGKKPLLFVMTADTRDADDITRRLNHDPLYAELNNRTINLHTNLKGKLKARGTGVNKTYEFIESEKDISDEDLKALRRLSRELDLGTSPFYCIVSVLMLREGWDVRNVTTIVPLRPYTSKANILPEQTLGRGLRRMTPPGGVNEIVAVVEHEAFTSLYKEQLSQEGLDIAVVEAGRVPRTTITIFPDEGNKDLTTLDVLIPRLTGAHRIVPSLEGMTFDELREAFMRYQKLPLGHPEEREVQYEGRHLFTNEVVEQMRVKLPLLQNGWGAVSYYREELERATKIRGTHSVLAPLIQKFLEEVLFTETVTLADPRLVSRVADADVREHIRATFVPLIRKHTTMTEERTLADAPQSVTAWKPFQVTHSASHPAEQASKTPFNLVPCNRELEVAFTHYADNANDVAAFCKNAGPQSLRIDYLQSGGRLAFYTPDFLIRRTDGHYLLVETKGREDRDVPRKARAAQAWCQSASTRKVKWEYLYVPQGVFTQFGGTTIDHLSRTCAPALADILKEADEPQLLLPGFGPDDAVVGLSEFISQAELASLTVKYREAVSNAVTLFRFLEKKPSLGFGPAFQPMLAALDDAARALIVSLLKDDVPGTTAGQKDYFEPYYGSLRRDRDKEYHERHASNLRRTLVFSNGLMPIGLLEFCLAYCSTSYDVGGVFASVRKHFTPLAHAGLHGVIEQVYNFRNEVVAHADGALRDRGAALAGLKQWVDGLLRMSEVMQAETTARSAVQQT